MLRLRQICLVARELKPIVSDLEEVFGLAVCYNDPAVGKYGLENALLPIGTNFLEVVAPTQDGTAAGRYLDRRKGDGGYMVILQCDNAEERRKRVTDMGVRIINKMDYGEFVGTQLHPRDTGGCMLEHDYNAGSQAEDGPWHPAGADWKPAVHTDRVAKMIGAELQSDDPSALAARWGEILDVPVTANESDDLVLKLDNAELRFVKNSDGRGEGLGGVDLAVSDKNAVLSAANKAGCDVLANDLINVCGTRFKLIG